MFKQCFFILLLFLLSITSSFAQSKSNDEVNEKVNEIVLQIFSAYKKLESAKYRNRVAVLDFEEKSGEAKERKIGFAVSELLSTRLFQTGRFRMVERKQLAKALEEIALGMTGIVDENSAQEAGRMLGADMIVVGSVSEFGNLFNINVRLLETETGAVLTASAIQIEKPLLIKTTEQLLSEQYGFYKGIPKYRLVFPLQWDFVQSYDRRRHGYYYNDNGPILYFSFRFSYEITPKLIMGIQAGIPINDDQTRYSAIRST
jgi:TolB-like protein